MLRPMNRAVPNRIPFMSCPLPPLAIDLNWDSLFKKRMEITGLMKGRGKALFTGKYQEYITPKWLYEKYNDIYHFTLDPCTNENNPLGAPKFYTEKDDGLKQSWDGERVYCNPPYHSKNIIKWIVKAHNSKADVVVMLLPSRTDTKWFHDYVWQQPNVDVEFVRGRLKFEGVAKNTAPFPSMLVIFK